MCRWLTYHGRPIFLEKLIMEPVNSLIEQSLHARKAAVATNGDGFGVGWYGERETPGIYRETLPAWNDPNLRHLAHQIRSGLFFAHVRASTGTATSRANCHPFGHGRWLFMHNGQIGGYDRLRRRLNALLTDDLYACLQGTTDSELIFHLLFRFGLEDDPVAALAKTVETINAAAAEIAEEEPFKLTACLSDGRRVIAVRYSSDGVAPSLFACQGEDHMIVVSEPLDAELAAWSEVPNNHLLIADGSCRMTVRPFQDAASVTAI
ncbi:class II glutamine amidotransferase [Inquilinus sp. CAU 1745]|uniref:class II glutamine amidotransferase n=1 Tax=Inquilinus sp. CAU 1745 TaxID=3140369 RepID=UPI00325A91C5